jgi:sarcosine oxidase subunit delta
MSIRIACEHCGTRPLEEYVYGEVFVVPDMVADPVERNLDRAFNHTNPEGPVTEAWFHLYGCRRWISIVRDTATDRILE